ncbi:MAG TPA: acyl-CoA synthetase FdrA [Thermodesulfobacteriota bacterium]
MPVTTIVKPGLYKDSVALMRISEAAAALAGVRRAALVMGTAANKAILEEAGQLTADAQAAGPDDLVVVLEGESEQALADASGRVEAMLAGEEAPRGGAAPEERPARALATALRRLADANLVLVSTPGAYAGAEALKALRRGLHVFLFSNNVPVEQEVHLKALARRKGLLVMGPDCGTAIIGGVPLGFANVVRRGGVGLVAAAGTGLQEVSCLIDRQGEGISHGIGTGSNDVSAPVGGATMQQGFEALRADPATRVIVLVSKPPAPAVAAKMLGLVGTCEKPVVVLFLGGDPEPVRRAGAVPAVTLEDAAAAGVALARGEAPGPGEAAPLPDAERVRAEAARLGRGQRYIRGLFSGGTLCTEAQVVWRERGIDAYSNVPLDAARRLGDPDESREHTAVDMGTDEFTVGRPHPMIDFRYRVERLRREARDPATAVVLLDVVLGYGAHPDPAGALVPAVREARALAEREGRHLSVVASVCGTEGDPQRLSAQEARLREAGVLLLPSNAAAARAAVAIATRGAGPGEAGR